MKNQTILLPLHQTQMSLTSNYGMHFEQESCGQHLNKVNSHQVLCLKLTGDTECPCNRGWDTTMAMEEKCHREVLGVEDSAVVMEIR